MEPARPNVLRQPIPGSGSSFNFDADVVPPEHMSDQISEIKLVKQPKIFREDGSAANRHLHHWWLYFKTLSGHWIKVDLTLYGYRIAWGVDIYSSTNRVRNVAPPTCLKVKDIVDTVTGIARAKTEYINPKDNLDNANAKEYQIRFSCQDFVKLLLRDLNNLK